MVFDNGLTAEQRRDLDHIEMQINVLVHELHALPKHRSFSLAITKLEEARQWVDDRRRKPATEGS